MKKDLIVEIISTLFIILFAYAGLSKLLDYERFRIQLAQSPLLTTFSRWIAIILPIAEILIALFLAFAKLRLVALYFSFSLMTLFTAYIVTILRFSDYIPCSCGGILQNMSWNTHLIFNIFFMMLAIVAITVQSNINRETIMT